MREVVERVMLLGSTGSVGHVEHGGLRMVRHSQGIHGNDGHLIFFYRCEKDTRHDRPFLFSRGT
jgi:hypothetical protein